MKNLTKTLILLLLSNFAQAQVQEKSYDDIIHIGLPSYIYKPNNADAVNFITNRKDLIYHLPSKNILFYTYNEILICLSATKGTIKSTYLDSQKSFFDYMNAQGTGTNKYSSEIKSINNARVLIVQEERATSYCSFYIYATNGNNNMRSRILLEYKLNDKVAAEKIAETILANIRFVEKPMRE
jgi:hypothetical protein